MSPTFNPPFAPGVSANDSIGGRGADNEVALDDASGKAAVTLERLQFIRSLRDDAGFSLTQIGQLLEDEAARERNRERFRETHDPAERRALLGDAVGRVDRQIEILEAKAARLATMIDEARARRRHLDAHLLELDGGPAPHPDREEKWLETTAR